MAVLDNIANFTPQQLSAALSPAIESQHLVNVAGQNFVPNVDFSVAVDALNQGVQAALGTAIGIS
jgi:hypothetical protein